MLQIWVWTTSACLLALPSLARAQALAEAPDDSGDPPTNREDRPQRREDRAPARAQTTEPPPLHEPPAAPLSSWDWEALTGDWRGRRTALEDAGVDFSANLIYDIGRVLEGGLREGSAGRGLLDVSVLLDFESLAQLQGSALSVDFLSAWGGDSFDEAGDWQWSDNIDGPTFAQIAELWWEQKLLDGLVRLKIGKVEANSEFAYTDNAADFLNSSYSFSPTIFVLPSYPDPATAVIAFVYPTPDLSFGFGVFDGATHAGVPTGDRGPGTFFGGPSDLFFIGEAALRWGADALPARLSLGGWGHSGDFDRFDGGVDDGTAGFYATFDHALWRASPGDPEDTRGVALAAQLGWADPDVSEAEWHAGLGLVWNGPIGGRDADAAGIGATWVGFSREEGAGFAERGELALEVFYRLQITPFFSVKPDVQYIVDPSGNPDADNALVATLRIEVAF